ncbi:hypothetical protein Hypma_006894 [Hypsizygus marmoreus]|uniref:Uncharacterized protein n=1 Tax=Hypsizygus marmoreus TaxID=39966 RepID=A0A369JUU7_HYPMA|nr:hypothetical protein Hypma_006894 [Hypsizygus marmoreus]
MLPATTDNLLLSCLPPRELIRFGATTRANDEVVSSYMSRAFTIDDLLSTYFTPSQITQFRLVQGRTGAIISGSTAVEFFDRQRFEGSDLDVYIEHASAEILGLWLLESGYSFLPRSFQNPVFPDVLVDPLSEDTNGEQSLYVGFGVDTVCNFVKTSPDRRVQLMTTRGPVMDVILSFHSTCVMNIITHRAAFSLFPFATFVEKRSLRKPIDSLRQMDAEDKWASRGWSFPSGIETSEATDPKSEFCQGFRRVGDHKCWVIPLRAIPGLPRDTATFNSWNQTVSMNGLFAATYCRMKAVSGFPRPILALGADMGACFSLE